MPPTPGQLLRLTAWPQRLAHLIGRFGKIGSLDDTTCSWLPNSDHLLTCMYVHSVPGFAILVESMESINTIFSSSFSK